MRCKAERDLGETANRVMWAVRVFLPPPVRAGANCVNRQAMTPACKQHNTKTLQIDDICFGQVLTRCCDCCCHCCCHYRVLRGCICFSPLALSCLAVLSLAEHFGLICIIFVSRVCSSYLVYTHTIFCIVRDGTDHISKGQESSSPAEVEVHQA